MSVSDSVNDSESDSDTLVQRPSRTSTEVLVVMMTSCIVWLSKLSKAPFVYWL